jgi:hypothetical protein
MDGLVHVLRYPVKPPGPPVSPSPAVPPVSPSPAVPPVSASPVPNKEGEV